MQLYCYTLIRCLAYLCTTVYTILIFYYIRTYLGIYINFNIYYVISSYSIFFCTVQTAIHCPHRTNTEQYNYCWHFSSRELSHDSYPEATRYHPHREHFFAIGAVLRQFLFCDAYSAVL